MPLPSLVKKGSIIPRPKHNKETIEELKNTVAIDYITKWLRDRITEYGAPKAKKLSDRILVVRARTGSGKSTAMPVEIYRLFNPSFKGADNNYRTDIKGTYIGANILCTQPRVLTARDIPSELADADSNPWSTDMILGETIGYSTGSDKMPCNNCLIYATLDTLLLHLRIKTDAELMKLYRVIILDEVHERNITFDIVVMLLKRFMKRVINDEKCPILIFTSATFDVEKYANYLEVDLTDNIIDVEGVTFPVENIFLKYDTNDYIKEAVKIIDRIHNQKENPKDQKEGDILVFLPGKAQMKNLKEELQKVIKKDNPIMISILDRGSVTTSEAFRDLKLDYSELKVNDKYEYDSNGKYIATRRIFTGTTVAETGVTIGTLGYVIDSGLSNDMETYFPYGVSGLNTKPEARSRALQRRGRVGRKFPGYCYYLFTEETYNSLLNIQYPAIIYNNISRELMSLFTDSFNINDLDMLDMPPIDSLKYALTNNIMLGYLDPYTYELTKMGELLKNTQYIPLECFRAIQSAYLYEVAITDIITIVAMGTIFMPRPKKYKPSDILKDSLPSFFFNPKVPDHLAFFRAVTLDVMIEQLFYFESFVKHTKKSTKDARDWCDKVGLSYSDMITVVETRIGYLEDLVKMGLPPFENKEFKLISTNMKTYLPTLKRIKKCMYDGYKLNLITKDESEENKYIDRFGNRIKITHIDEKLSKYCKTLLADKITLMGDFDSYRKTIIPNRISILDGYVNDV